MTLFNLTDATGQKDFGPIIINLRHIAAIYPMDELCGAGSAIYTIESAPAGTENRYFVKEKFNQILVLLNVMSIED